MAVEVVQGKYPHIGWCDLEGKGTLTEIAIVKNGPTGLFFIRLNRLDAIDKQRLFKIISNRNSKMYELWDLMSNITIGNGANALDYFHQHVKCLTPQGQIISPSLGRIGAPDVTGMVKASQVQQAVQQQAQAQQVNEAAQVAPTPSAAPAPAKRGRGRPKKST